MRDVEVQVGAREPARECRLAVGTVLELDRLRFHTQTRREQLPQACPPHDESAGVPDESKPKRPVAVGGREEGPRCANGFGGPPPAPHPHLAVLARGLGLPKYGKGGVSG